MRRFCDRALGSSEISFLSLCPYFLLLFSFFYFFLRENRKNILKCATSFLFYFRQALVRARQRTTLNILCCVCVTASRHVSRISLPIMGYGRLLQALGCISKSSLIYGKLWTARIDAQVLLQRPNTGGQELQQSVIVFHVSDVTW